MVNGDIKLAGQKRIYVTAEQLSECLLEAAKTGYINSRLQIVCIGTDRSSGDCLGPLVGTFLTEAGCRSVIGTLEFPCDSSNIADRLKELEKGRPVLAVDACLGQPSLIGTYQVGPVSIEPGKSAGKRLPVVGEYSIAAIVNATGRNQYSILQHTSLYRTMIMAKQIASAIIGAFPLSSSGGVAESFRS